MARFPERSLTIALLRRGTFVWLLVRAVVMSMSAVGSRGVSVGLLPTTAVALALVAGALGFLDARRRNEDRFLANLGVSPIVIYVLSTIPALLGELVLGLSSQR